LVSGFKRLSLYERRIRQGVSNKNMSTIQNIVQLNFLAGKKTYIAAIVGIILTGLKVQGIIDQGTFEALVSIFGFLGLVSLRKAV